MFSMIGSTTAVVNSNHASLPVSSHELHQEDHLSSSMLEHHDSSAQLSKSSSSKTGATRNGSNKKSSRTTKSKSPVEMVFPTPSLMDHNSMFVSMSQVQNSAGAGAVPFYHPVNMGGYSHPGTHPHIHPLAIPIPSGVVGKPPLKKSKISGDIPSHPLPIPPPPYGHHFPPFAYEGMAVMNPTQSIAMNAQALLQIQRRLQQASRAKSNASSADIISLSRESDVASDAEDQNSADKSYSVGSKSHSQPQYIQHFPGFPMFPQILPSGPHPTARFGCADITEIPPIPVSHMQHIIDQRNIARGGSTVVPNVLTVAALPPKKRKPSAEAKQRRKERNKLLARRTRLKKKIESEGMRDSLVALLLENERLRIAVQEKLDPTISQPILSACYQLPESVKELVKSIVNSHQRALWNEITTKQRSFCVVDPNALDCPILYVSKGFCTLTGYTPQECIGRNCRFLQGPKTDPVVIKMIRDNLYKKSDVMATLLNYRKNGDTFWNKLELHHCYDENEAVKFIIGVQTECDDQYIYTRWARRRSTELLLQNDDDDEDQLDEDDEDGKSSSNGSISHSNRNSVPRKKNDNKKLSPSNSANSSGKSSSTATTSATISESSSSSELNQSPILSTSSSEKAALDDVDIESTNQQPKSPAEVVKSNPND